MLPEVSPLTALHAALAGGSTTPVAVANACSDRVNGNASRNTYIQHDRAALLQQAETLVPGSPLYGVPISIKDLFDLKGTRTSAGTFFYDELNPVAETDSAVAASLKAAGALITGKTHLHPLAYGLTGENLDYGSCLQPRDESVLTGGSSSGAAASVQEGSALAAIGTDTGGSVRIPAALCGLVGYRASHSLPTVWQGMWSGGVHLSQSFDTCGLFVRDPRDMAPIAEALFHLPEGKAPAKPRIGVVAQSFYTDCNPEVIATFAAWKHVLKQAGAVLTEFDATTWNDSYDIYAGIQANEAARIHRANFAGLLPTLDPAIAQRLLWGDAHTDAEIASLRARHAEKKAAIAALFAEFDFLMLPSAPVNRLPVGEDYTQARSLILRYTTPFSLAGVPVLTMPGELLGAGFGTGIQLAAAQLQDATLLEFGASLPI